MLGFGNATARYYIGSNATGDAVQLFLTAMECDVDVSVSLDFYSFVPRPTEAGQVGALQRDERSDQLLHPFGGRVIHHKGIPDHDRAVPDSGWWL